ncbi:MAG: beta-lactamase family protein [Clostridia bacterium]|nr:beta-lactamase family protein [Clostridia bacterium]
MFFDTKAVDEKVRALVARDKLPGVSISVLGPEGTVFEKGYGWRDGNSTIPVDPDTMFGIASMSKSITALALAILETEGKLSYDDPVCKYFPNFSVPGAARDTVTLRTLAMHTSGIPPMEPLEWSIAMNSVNRQSEWIDAMRKSSPNQMNTIDHIIEYIAACPYPTVGAPGENMSYCNEGYAILSYVVDMAAGIPLEQFCMERIFRPLGMTRTIMDDDCVSARELSGGNITSLFERDENGELVCDDDWSILPPFRGCAMVKSTARDMAVYYRCLSNYGMHENRQVLPRAAVEAMIGPSIPASPIASYGLGLYKRVKCGHTICEHSGGLHGISTKGGLLLGEGYGFAVLCNEGDADMDDIMWVLYNAVMGEPLDTCHRWFVPAGRDFSDPEMLTGSFVCREGVPAITTVSIEEGRLTAIVGGNKTNLTYCGGTRFLAMDANKPESVRSRLEFFIRNGHAWGVRCGSRIYSLNG